MWDAQEETKTLPSASSTTDVNASTNVLQSAASLSALNSNPSSASPLMNTASTTLTPAPSLSMIPQVQQNQSQSQISLSLPNSLMQTSNNLLLSSQAMASTTNSNSSTASIAPGNGQHVQANSQNLSSSLTSNDLNARFDMWTECLAELFVYENILKVPLTRIEAWRMVFFRLTLLFPYVDPK